MTFPNVRRSLSCLAATTALLAGSVAFASPASASDVDLGAPETFQELLASPEYIEEHADLARLYQAFFNREPDVGGLSYWIDIFEDGSTLTEISLYFSQSQEFLNTYGADPANPTFLDAVYQNVLGREYDQDGYDYWLGLMNDGLPRHETVFWIVGGQEFKNNYPFTGTFADIRSALLTSADVPADYTDFGEGRLELTEQEILEQHECDRRRIVHSNVYQVFHGREDGSEFVLQDMYAFSTTASAQQVLENHRLLDGGRCDEVITFPNGARLTVTYDGQTTSTALDDAFDDYVALAVTWQWDEGPTYRFHLVVSRVQNVVVVTDWTHQSSAAPSFQAASDYAILSGERTKALLGIN